MADISTGRQRGIVPFVDETTGRLPDSYLPQGVIDLQGDLEQAVSDASQSATAAKASETAAKASASQAQSNATAANSSARAAAASAESAQTATESAASSKDAAAQSASKASASAQAAEASKTNAASSASAAETSKTNAAASASAAKASETNAAASATAAQQAVDGFGLEVGTTTTGEPGSDASVTIQKNGTKYTANFTIPRGDKGADGVNENVPLGTASGIVAQATDAYPALPRKVQVKGRTVKNLWPVLSAVSNGVTFDTDETGLTTISGTGITGNAYAFGSGEGLTAGKTYVGIVSATVANLRLRARVQGVLPDAGSVSVIGNPFTTSGTTIQIPAGTTNIKCVIALEGVQSQTVNASFRVMLVEGDTVPDVFVPSGVNTVEPTKLIAAGKNLASVTSNSNNPNLLISDILPPGDYVFSAVGDILERGYTLRAGSLEGPDIANCRSQTTKFSLTQYASIFLNMYNVGSITNIQIEKGASATRFEQPVKRETNLPPDISLADGDTLTIDRDGTTQIVHSEGEPTVLENVTLPELPAPTFNVYTTGGYVPPTVDVDYERDVNLVIANLEAKIAALQVADKTN